VNDGGQDNHLGGGMSRPGAPTLDGWAIHSGHAPVALAHFVTHLLQFATDTHHLMR
jgi:hypothetical protein